MTSLYISESTGNPLQMNTQFILFVRVFGSLNTDYFFLGSAVSSVAADFQITSDRGLLDTQLRCGLSRLLSALLCSETLV